MNHIIVIPNLLEIKIENQKLDWYFLDSYTDNIENYSKIFSYKEIRTVTLKDCQLCNDVYYDIFQDFVNIKELNILNCDLDSKSLHIVLHCVNPYSLSKLDLSDSTFDFFSEEDLN